MPKTHGGREYSVAGLRAKCSELRTLLLAPSRAITTEEELQEIWPGGARNPRRGLDGWIECYALLGEIAGRGEARDRHTAAATNQLESVVRAAASRQPIPVVLSIGERLVYPKSAWALAWLDSLDAILQPVAALATELAADEATADDELRGFSALTQAMAFRTWAWILLTEGVGLPFDDEGVINPPAYTEQLLAEDLLAIYVAHRKLHFEAITIMAAAMPSEDGVRERSRLTLSGFLSGYANEHGVPPSHIVRRWSFPEALAGALSAAEAHRVAEANAKAKRSESAR